MKKSHAKSTPRSFLPGRQFVIIVFGSLILLTLSLYLFSLRGEFVSDDRATIVEQSHALFSGSYLAHDLRSIPRSILYVSVARTAGLNPAVFRLINIIFHIGFLIMTYRLAVLLTKRPPVGYLAAALAGVHPIMIESVAWISGGIYAQAGFFSLVSLYSYILGSTQNNLKQYWYAGISFLLALWSSEKTVILPLFFLWYELCLGSWKTRVLRILPFFVIAGAWVIIALQSAGERLAAIGVGTVSSPMTQAILHIRLIPLGIGQYLKLYLWPFDLSLYHSELFYTPERIAWTAVSFALLVAAIGYGFRKNRMVLFATGFILLSLLPTTLGSFGLSWVYAERYAYLGSFAVFLLAGYGWYAIYSVPRMRIAMIGIAVLLISLTWARSYMRIQDWRSEDALWIATARTAPSDPKTHNNLGDMYLRQEKFAEAEQSFIRAIRLNPRYAPAYHNLGNVYSSMGDEAEAIRAYRQAIQINPSSWQSYQTISILYFKKGAYAEALPYMEQAARISPQNPQIHANVGLIYVNLKQQDKAREAFSRALAIDPRNELARVGLELAAEIK